jgi:hypothetical protein
MKSLRKVAKAMARGRAIEQRLVIPLAFEVAAQISARPPDEFRNDPTQLTNGLVELQKITGADGIICSLGSETELESSKGQGLNLDLISSAGPVFSSLTSVARLRTTFGEESVLVAGINGPRRLSKQFDLKIQDTLEFFCGLTKKYCEAGVDVVLIFEDPDFHEEEKWCAGVKTAENICKFHQVSLLSWEDSFLQQPFKYPLLEPCTEGKGFVFTSEILDYTANINDLALWVERSKG